MTLVARTPTVVHSDELALEDTRRDGPVVSVRRTLIAHSIWFLAPLALCPLVALVRPGDRRSALERADQLLALQRSFGVAVEPSIHAWFGTRPLLIGSATAFYFVAHLSAVVATACWLAARRPAAYLRFRRTFVVAQVLTVGVYLAVPMAPLRMLLNADSERAGASWTRSVQYELAAMPSGHVVFALIVSIAVWRSAHRRWRWLASAHLGCTLIAIVATANHLLADAAGAVVVVMAAMIVVRLVEAVRPGPGEARDPIDPKPGAVA